MFPKGFQVPKYVPQDVPNSTWVLSHMVCTKFNFPVYKQKSRGAHLFLFPKWVQRGASIGDMPNVPKKLLMGQSIWLPENKIKGSERTHDLINRTMNKDPQSIIVGTHYKLGGMTLNAPNEPCPIVNVLHHRLASWHTH
jgi:hypothetical protein